MNVQIQKGSRKEPSNYRPISLTCICSKLLEHIVHTGVMSQLMDYNILLNAKFGFYKNYLAKLQVIQTTHDLALKLYNKSKTDVILLDFSKAFNKAPHEHLILKLHYCGIRGNTLDWISSFLSNHTQHVICGGFATDPVDIAM